VERQLVRHTFRRLTFAVLFVFVVSSCAMLLAHLTPGDATMELLGEGASPEVIARERARLGLDRPLLEQYADWIGHVLRLDLGESARYRRPVTALIGERMGHTLRLGAAALALATLLGLPLGVIAGARPRLAGRLVHAASTGVLSLPPLVSALLLVFLGASTGWFPAGGSHLLLPTLALGLPFAATLQQLQSQSMAAALDEPHIQAARARGLPESRLIWRHALRDALRPVLAVYGIIIGTLFSGSFVVEFVASFPGLGRLMYEALVSRDTYLVAGCAATGAAFLAAGTLIADLLLVAVDPRLRQEAP
jgi:peptide/nickel transport system permease protein